MGDHCFHVRRSISEGEFEREREREREEEREREMRVRDNCQQQHSFAKEPYKRDDISEGLVRERKRQREKAQETERNNCRRTLLFMGWLRLVSS